MKCTSNVKSTRTRLRRTPLCFSSSASAFLNGVGVLGAASRMDRRMRGVRDILVQPLQGSNDNIIVYFIGHFDQYDISGSIVN